MKSVSLLPLLLVLWIPTCFLLVFQPWSHDCRVVDGSNDYWKEFTYIEANGDTCGVVYKGIGEWKAYNNHTTEITKSFVNFQEAKAYVERRCKPYTSPTLN